MNYNGKMKSYEFFSEIRKELEQNMDSYKMKWSGLIIYFALVIVAVLMAIQIIFVEKEVIIMGVICLVAGIWIIKLGRDLFNDAIEKKTKEIMYDMLDLVQHELSDYTHDNKIHNLFE